MSGAGWELLAGKTTGVVIVDHGSRRARSNRALERIADDFAAKFGLAIVEPAHMELAEPSLATAFARCVARGAEAVVVHPFFLLPGRHWTEDIPRLAAEASQAQDGIPYLVTAPLGTHATILDVMRASIEGCVAHASGRGEACELCVEHADACRIRPIS